MKAAIIGATGGIGAALVEALAGRGDVERVYALSRRGTGPDHDKVQALEIDILDEASIEAAAGALKEAGAPDLVIVASGVLSRGEALTPEKSWRHQTFEAFRDVFDINTFGPAMVAKHFLPLLPRSRRCVFAALSARVGSIGDNGFGGWHAYRASKAALNMLVRNYAIEMGRRNEDAICVTLHPGTVDTALSEPFQSNVPDKQLFSPAQSAGYLLDVIDGLTPENTGHAYDWKGERIPF